MKKKLLVVSVLIIALLVPFFVIDQPNGGRVSAATVASYLFADYYDSETLISTATLDDDFADDTIIVVLNRQTTMSFSGRNVSDLEFRTYNTRDFSEIALSSVRDVTPGLDLATTKVRARVSESMNIEHTYEIDETWTVNLSEFRQILVLTLQEHCRENVLTNIRTLERRPDVFSAEANVARIGIQEHMRIVMESEAAVDSGFWGQTNVDDRQAAVSPIDSPWDFWGPNRVRAFDAHNLTRGSSAITIGVLDTGIQANHPDLVGQMNLNLFRNFTSELENLFIDPAPGFHGTQVAGIIVARRNEMLGFAGVAPGVRVASLRVLRRDGGGIASYVVDAITFATQQRIPILNMSFSGGFHAGELQAIQAFPGLVVAAAGNQGQDADTFPRFPASHRLPNVISVGASNRDDTRRHDSNFGRTNVDLFAPGTEINTTLGPAGVRLASQTSIATPFVAGVAALVMSVNPNIRLGAEVTREIILASVDRVPALNGLSVTGGRLNAYAALRKALTLRAWQQPIWTSTSNTHGTVTHVQPFDGNPNTYLSGPMNVTMTLNTRIIIQRIEIDVRVTGPSSSAFPRFVQIVINTGCYFPSFTLLSSLTPNRTVAFNLGGPITNSITFSISPFGFFFVDLFEVRVFGIGFKFKNPDKVIESYPPICYTKFCIWSKNFSRCKTIFMQLSS